MFQDLVSLEKQRGTGSLGRFGATLNYLLHPFTSLKRIDGHLHPFVVEQVVPHSAKLRYPLESDHQF